jgi:hypothetical protein
MSAGPCGGGERGRVDLLRSLVACLFLLLCAGCVSTARLYNFQYRLQF